MHWLGAIMIVTAGIYAGIIYISEKRQRLIELENICGALEMMGGELQTSLSSLPEVCNALKNRSEGAAKELFVNLGKSFDRLGETEFSKLWDENVKTVLKMLSSEEIRQVSALGKVLGRCEVEHQLESLDGVVLFLRTNLEAARNAYPQERKLGIGVGAAAALLLALGLL